MVQSSGPCTKCRSPKLGQRLGPPPPPPPLRTGLRRRRLRAQGRPRALETRVGTTGGRGHGRLHVRGAHSAGAPCHRPVSWQGKGGRPGQTFAEVAPIVERPTAAPDSRRWIGVASAATAWLGGDPHRAKLDIQIRWRPVRRQGLELLRRRRLGLRATHPEVLASLGGRAPICRAQVEQLRH